MLEVTVDEKYFLSPEQVAGFVKSSEKAKAKGNGFRFEPCSGEGYAKRVSTKAGSRKTDNFIIDCADSMGVLRLGGLYDGDGKRHQAGSIYEVGGVAPTLSTMQGGNQEPMIVASRGRGENNEQHLEPRKDGMTNTLTSVQKDNYVATNFRIRKLTPKECWRLMGFSDGDFEKAEKVNSNTQLYKQAGNSIVVNVLEAILKNLLKEEYDK